MEDLTIRFHGLQILNNPNNPRDKSRELNTIYEENNLKHRVDHITNRIYRNKTGFSVTKKRKTVTIYEYLYKDDNGNEKLGSVKIHKLFRDKINSK